MAFKVFLSYRNGPEEQLVVFRLQTLAAAYGIHVFVPPRNGLQRSPARQSRPLSEDVQRMIDQSDCVLAIMTGVPGRALQAELTYASAKGKTILPVLRADMEPPAFLGGMPVFRFSPNDPSGVETKVVEFLRQQQFSKQQSQAMGALVAIGLGLFLLAAFSEK